jgi:hypothetical protein
MTPGKTSIGERAPRRRIAIGVLGACSIALIALTSLVSPQSFSYLTTLFVGVTSCALFLVVWQSKSVGRDAFYLIIAAASMCIGALELIQGALMKSAAPFSIPPFLLGTRIASAAALIDAAALFMAPLFLKRMPPRGILLPAVLCVAAASVLITMVWPIVSMTPRQASGADAGLTGGCAVCILLAGALLLAFAKRRSFEPELFALLVASLGSRLLASAAVLLVAHPTQAMIAVMHLLTSASVFLLYQGIASQSLRETDRLLAATATALELKHLSGIIPICMSCKRIQVGEEEWQQLEAYVSAHSRARFSHGICPDCAQQVFAEMVRDGTS